jgi:hypothetical protein
VARPKIHHPAIAAILLCCGVAMLTFGLIWLPGIIKSSSWPSTEGRITDYRIESEVRGKRITPQYAVAVDYKYRVGEKDYEGGEFSHANSAIGSLHNTRHDAIYEYLHDPQHSKWQQGQPVTVFYDPENPSDAVLRTGRAGYAWSLIVLGAVMCATGIREFLIIKRLRASGNRQSAPSA